MADGVPDGEFDGCKDNEVTIAAGIINPCHC